MSFFCFLTKKDDMSKLKNVKGGKIVDKDRMGSQKVLSLLIELSIPAMIGMTSESIQTPRPKLSTEVD